MLMVIKNLSVHESGPVPQNTPFSLRNHYTLGGGMIVFSSIYQEIESIRMVVSPDTPLICLAS